ncbi:MAG: ATP synthase F1, gamma subunit [Candidatus Roizmanbacteria bacterium GW2011_GWA2_37_7]|uniref:ATP synthase F1, gamma subunit n=1 Tax=Candidatus Roizmanbacteria bacterium GW2011_GWA2_37_7 TaxID=1618481 RepID=A0A0G0HFX4_9BACT|nr:MAG: ATP synthase F1, gamma subunit [Candidatus Roizmanbacteria bacterium GW2011_GWA2_37_7]
MQMVSAVKMRKAQQLEIEGRPYRDGLTEIIATLSNKIDSSHAKILQVDTSKAERDLIIVVSSNKGLAGSFNINLFRYILHEYPSFNNVDIITVGSKGSQFFGRLKDTHIIADFSTSNLILEASALFDFIQEKYFTGIYRSVIIIYNQFISTLRSDPTKKILLPLTFVNTTKEDQSKTDSIKGSDLIIEPSPQEILEEVLKSFIEYTIRGALISSEAVEHSMRMMAMKSATDNAVELIYQMTLLANRLRQEKITNELLDMVTAKESVEAS